jgi:hypothetical protein
MNTTEYKETSQQVIELVRYYALWWFYLEKANTIRYDRVERGYPDFFITIVDSLRCSFIVTAYRLFDKRSDVRSLIELIRITESSDKPLAASLQAKADSIAPILEKTKLLRHKVMAHRDNSQTPEQTFFEADVTPAEMKKVVSVAIEIISTASGPQWKDRTERELKSVEDAVTTDAFNLMRVLGQHVD